MSVEPHCAVTKSVLSTVVSKLKSLTLLNPNPSEFPFDCCKNVKLEKVAILHFTFDSKPESLFQNLTNYLSTFRLY